MPNNKRNQDIDKNVNSKSCEDRRTRVNRIKVAIVIIVIILLILPTICCIILGLQVSKLQRQVNDLASLHSQYGLDFDSSDAGVYAYAAEKKDIITDRFGHTLVPQLGAGTSEDLEKSTSYNQSLTNAEVPIDGADNTAAEENSVQETEDNQPVSEDKASSKDQGEQGKYADKKIYLTFDDGPSIYTDDILDILAEYKVKATFFVIGKTDKTSKKLYQRIVEEGHTLGMHSYSHQYSKIYNSVEDFDKDFTKLWKLLYDTTGYKPSIFRFPGGSDNMVNKNGMEEFIHYLNEAKVVYFDWNVLNGDATGVVYTKEQLINNVINGIATKDNSIVLMHDSQAKETTVDSLPELLDDLLSEGAQILPLNEDVSPIQMIKADTIKQ